MFYQFIQFFVGFDSPYLIFFCGPKYSSLNFPVKEWYLYRQMEMWLYCFQPFLGTYTDLQKATVSFILFVYMEELGSHWPDIHGIW